MLQKYIKPKYIIILFTAIIAISAIFFIYFITQKNNLHNGNYIFEISKNSSTRSIAQKLHEEGLITRIYPFLILSKFNHIIHNKIISYGEFKIKKNSNMLDILEIFYQKDFVKHKLSFPEGIMQFEVIKKLNMESKLTGNVSFDKDNEGRFLPETYVFSKHQSKKEILRQMSSNLEETLEAAWNERDNDLPITNKREMLILASIVEKESASPLERKTIAQVFLSRIKKNMPLQADPTVIYGKNLKMMENGGTIDIKITKKDLKDQNKYNTYTNIGLPQGPICNPGKESIFAVAHPAKTEYIYFVSNNNNGHNFSKTLKEHNKFVSQYRKKMRRKNARTSK